MEQMHMTTSVINVPSQFPVPKITMQTKSHNLKFNVSSKKVPIIALTFLMKELRISDNGYACRIPR